MASRLPELIGRARSLSAERDRLVEAVADRWAAALKGQPVSAQDLEQLWVGLTENVVREVLKNGRRQWVPEAVRREAAQVIAQVRVRVERTLREAGDGSVHGA